MFGSWPADLLALAFWSGPGLLWYAALSTTAATWGCTLSNHKRCRPVPSDRLQFSAWRCVRSVSVPSSGIRWLDWFCDSRGSSVTAVIVSAWGCIGVTSCSVRHRQLAVGGVFGSWPFPSSGLSWMQGLRTPVGQGPQAVSPPWGRFSKVYLRFHSAPAFLAWWSVWFSSPAPFGTHAWRVVVCRVGLNMSPVVEIFACPFVWLSALAPAGGGTRRITIESQTPSLRHPRSSCGGVSGRMDIPCYETLPRAVWHKSYETLHVGCLARISINSTSTIVAFSRPQLCIINSAVKVWQAVSDR